MMVPNMYPNVVHGHMAIHHGHGKHNPSACQATKALSKPNGDKSKYLMVEIAGPVTYPAQLLP